MAIKDNYARYLKTYAGQELLKSHSLNSEGTWEVRGEDDNCDMAGSHYEPRLGFYSGRLEDVIHMAVELHGFWAWGGGGSIRKHCPPTAKKVTRASATDQKKLKASIAEKEAELERLKKELFGS